MTSAAYTDPTGIPSGVGMDSRPPGSVTLADEAFARLVGSAGDRVFLFEVAPEFVVEGWSEPVRYRFVRSEGGLLTMELARV